MNEGQPVIIESAPLVNGQNRPIDKINPENQRKNLVSLADEETRNKARTLYVEGMTYDEVCKELGIAKGTWDQYTWKNLHGFRDLMVAAKKEKMILQTEKVSEKIMNFDTDDISDKKLAVQQKEAEFLRETIGKDTYSKRIETIGFNLNKNEPLDQEQKDKLSKLFGVKDKKPIDYVEAEFKPVEEVKNEEQATQ